jgi:hypothetical protein
VKDDAHGDFTPEMMKLPQATWIETFVEGVTDQNTDCPYSRCLPGSCTRSLVSCAQRLHVTLLVYREMDSLEKEEYGPSEIS